MSNVLSRAVSGQSEDTQVVAVTPDPTEGTSETHVRVFVQDVQDALAQIHAIVNETEVKYQALLTKIGL